MDGSKLRQGVELCAAPLCVLVSGLLGLVAFDERSTAAYLALFAVAAGLGWLGRRLLVLCCRRLPALSSPRRG